MFSPKLKKVIAGIVCLAFTVTNGSYAVEILNDGGQRQTVVERTKQYAGSLDLTEVRHKAEQAFQSSVKTGDGGVATLSGMQAKCNGFTTSSCGLACCGKQECDTICTANYMSAHGKETCTDPITTSPCGMSCCGKEDCEWVCQNYRIKLNDGDKCNGYIKTPTGENCCGYDECMAKTCNGKTKVVRKDDGKEVECCGDENCYDIMCDYTEKVQDVAGTVQNCCGRDDCNAKYCQNQTSVDSKVVPGKKNIACCGAADCHNKACENYTTTNTPVGQVECCGYEDCHNKECQGRTSAIDKDGNTVTCCENSGVKDQNGNDLRLCSAIDKERVQADEEKKKNNQTKVFVCKWSNKHQTSKGSRIEKKTFWICYNGKNEKVAAGSSYNDSSYLIKCPNITEIHIASLRKDSSGVGEDYQDRFSTEDTSYSAKQICSIVFGR